jgi:hypothetical protein
LGAAQIAELERAAADWDYPLEPNDILARLVALNLARAETPLLLSVLDI